MKTDAIVSGKKVALVMRMVDGVAAAKDGINVPLQVLRFKGKVRDGNKSKIQMRGEEQPDKYSGFKPGQPLSGARWLASSPQGAKGYSPPLLSMAYICIYSGELGLIVHDIVSKILAT
jgi:hypothetical protein